MAENAKPKPDEAGDPKGRDERVKIDLDPDAALKALLQVEPRPVEKDSPPDEHLAR
jgi:hypothetical protein